MVIIKQYDIPAHWLGFLQSGNMRGLSMQDIIKAREWHSRVGGIVTGNIRGSEQCNHNHDAFLEYPHVCDTYTVDVVLGV